MNIDRDKLAGQAANIFWNHPGKAHDSSLVTIDFLVDAVLAEVAKHNAPDKPAYYKMSERKPTRIDALPSGNVLGFNSEDRCWYAVGCEAAVAVYSYWMPMPAGPESEDDKAFSQAIQDAGMSSNDPRLARRIWDAALAHRDNFKP